MADTAIIVNEYSLLLPRVILDAGRMTHAQTIQNRGDDSDWSFVLHDRLILISAIG